MLRHVMLVLLLFFTHCKKTYNVTFDDKKLGVQSGGAMFYDGKPLNGEIVQEFPGTNAKRVTTYRDGYEDGSMKAWSEDGILIEDRTYRKGVKVGIHRSWHNNGKDKFYSEFDNQGRYKNESWSWHDNGQVYEYKKYDAAGNVVVHKQLRPNGQVYQNIIVGDNGSIGVPGSKNCDYVSNKKKKT